MRLRQKKILDIIRTGDNVSIQQIEDSLARKNISVTEMTIQRDLNVLINGGYILRKGKARATRYITDTKSIGNVEFDINEYFTVPTDERMGLTPFNEDVFSYLVTLFNDEELNDVKTSTGEYNNRINSLTPAQMRKEVERLTIDLSWKSSEIEGNTYDLIDTEILIKENQASGRHTPIETQMILNHKDAIGYIFEHRDFKEVTVRKIEDLHRLLTNGLEIGSGIRKRAVRIGGTNYHPLDNQDKIEEALEDAVSTINTLKSPIEKALAAVLLISYIQPFGDGNKRTARILGNAILLSYNHCPLSYRSISKSEYKRAILIFYEQQSFYNFKQLFLEQYYFAVNEYFI